LEIDIPAILLYWTLMYKYYWVTTTTEQLFTSPALRNEQD
jgi:hypothetical protein